MSLAFLSYQYHGGVVGEKKFNYKSCVLSLSSYVLICPVIIFLLLFSFLQQGVVMIIKSMEKIRSVSFQKGSVLVPENIKLNQGLHNAL